jgi:molybdopterin synthase sulfur carrier subunit
MRIRLKAFARFRDLLGKELEVDLNEGSTVADLLAALLHHSVDLEEMIFDPSGKIKEEVNILVNGRHVESLEGTFTVLKEGDEVALFPAVVGG